MDEKYTEIYTKVKPSPANYNRMPNGYYIVRIEKVRFYTSDINKRDCFQFFFTVEQPNTPFDGWKGALKLWVVSNSPHQIKFQMERLKAINFTLGLHDVTPERWREERFRDLYKDYVISVKKDSCYVGRHFNVDWEFLGVVINPHVKEKPVVKAKTVVDKYDIGDEF